MSHIFDSTSETTLCVDCEALRFDDEGCGGFIRRTSDNAAPKLSFHRKKVGGRISENSKRLMTQQRNDSSPDFPTLAQSAAAGCGFCGFLRAAVLRADIPALGRQEDVSIRLCYAWGSPFWLNQKWGPEEGLYALFAVVYSAHEKVGILQFNIYSNDDALAGWLGLQRPPHRETLCPENISFIKRAIEACTETCHLPVETSFLPTRLVDLGTDPASHPRLINTADATTDGTLDPSQPIRYAALSYCWGNKADASAQTKTEVANLPERLQAIPISDMSAVLQDAVTVCQNLSVRYLWIDALCIIQNQTDLSDWQRESEQVGKVYQHAYFTICVLSSPNCHQSFLNRSQHIFTFNFKSSLYPTARGTYSLYSFGLVRRVQVEDSWASDLFNSSWHARGWVFQEELLSARKLYFGQLMVHLGCSQDHESENGESDNRRDSGDWSAAQLARLNRNQLYELFREATILYAEKRLSYESDRLPAFAGLAKQVFGSTGDTYLAGVWKEDLHRGLLWNPRPKQSLAERLDSLRTSNPSGAPSWSWASQPVYFEYGLHCLNTFSTMCHFQPEYAEVDAWTVLKGAGLNQLGEVETGTIRIRSKVLPVPADVVLIPHKNFPDLVRKAYRQGVIIAHCSLDWLDSSTTLERGELEMLLLSSSCCLDETLPGFYDEEGEEDEEDKEEKKNGEGNEEGEEYAEEDERECVNVAGEDHQGDTSCSGHSSNAEMDISDTLSEHGSIDTSSDDDSPDLCILCNDEEHNRHAWGLIIHPAEKPGEYYRVGLFLSRAGKVGGMQFFRNVEDRTIDII